MLRAITAWFIPFADLSFLLTALTSIGIMGRGSIAIVVLAAAAAGYIIGRSVGNIAKYLRERQKERDGRY